jgi:hypothetical protein
MVISAASGFGMGLPFFVTTRHSRSKNGVALLAYDPVVHADVQLSMDCRIKSGNDRCGGAEALALRGSSTSSASTLG